MSEAPLKLSGVSSMASSSFSSSSSTSTSGKLLTLAVLLALAHGGSGLKWLRFSVPSWTSRGEDAVLTCQFDLEGERLYSVKWYKAGREFYRYVPGDWPPQQQFPQHGITVDEARSDHQRVLLRRVTLEADGRYKCEVLTEAPHFRTLVRSAEMQVVELPEGVPEVTGGEAEYRLGDSVNLTCSAPPSIPPAALTWYINNQQAPQDYLTQYPVAADPSGRYESRLGLLFRAERWHFVEDRVSLRCTAAVSRLYHKDAIHSGVVIRPLVPALFEDQAAGESGVDCLRTIKGGALTHSVLVFLLLLLLLLL